MDEEMDGRKWRRKGERKHGRMTMSDKKEDKDEENDKEKKNEVTMGWRNGTREERKTRRSRASVPLCPWEHQAIPMRWTCRCSWLAPSVAWGCMRTFEPKDRNYIVGEISVGGTVGVGVGGDVGVGRDGSERWWWWRESEDREM
jgi:hypothetical protein